MRLYPTIHIKNGRCYNPAAPQSDKPNPFTHSPVKLAKLWEEAGAKCIHVVDVDGVFLGSPVHDDILKEIVDAVGIPVQAGGGIRSIKDIDHILSLGTARVVCGTQAVKNSRFVEEAIATFGEDRFIVGIDANNGMVAIEGRERLSRYNPIALVNALGQSGVRTVVYTDVKSSALQSGPSIENVKELVSHTNVDVIYAGGITCLADVKALCELDMAGIIIAGSLYQGTVDLKEAIDRFET